MIMIDSKAGQRLAKAKAALDLVEADEEVSTQLVIAVRIEFGQAADAVADELVAARHHEAEGD